MQASPRQLLCAENVVVSGDIDNFAKNGLRPVLRIPWLRLRLRLRLRRRRRLRLRL
jgi:hypothetical protein